MINLLEVKTILEDKEYVVLWYENGEGRWFYEYGKKGIYIFDIDSLKIILELNTFSKDYRIAGTGKRPDVEITYTKNYERNQKVELINGQLVINQGTCIDEVWVKGEDKIVRPCADKYPAGIYNWTGAVWVKVADN